jgi:hypothetical protein
VSRLMSVSLTEDAVRARAKTVTRRKGWQFLKVGDRLTLCRKVMGRKPGEPLVRLAEVEVTDVRREPLDRITNDDVDREGVPSHLYADTHSAICEECRPIAWAEWFARTMGGTYFTEVTRIEWRYL